MIRFLLTTMVTALVAAPTAAHADAWQSPSPKLASDGSRLVVAPAPGNQLSVRDDRTGKTRRVALPAGCTFTGMVGGGKAVTACGQYAPLDADPTQPPVFQTRHTLVELATGTAMPLPLVWGTSDASGPPTATLRAVGTRWAQYTVAGYHWERRVFVRNADGALRDEPFVQPPDQAVAADLSTAADQPLQPLCAPLRSPLWAFETAGHSGPGTMDVGRGGSWATFVRDASGSLMAWKCGAAAPVKIGTCKVESWVDLGCTRPVLGAGYATFRAGTRTWRVVRLRDRRSSTYSADAVAHTAHGVHVLRGGKVRTYPLPR